MRVIFGRAGSGKSRLCLEEIRLQTEADRLGKALILLVPEQATHQMEKNLIQEAHAQGFMRVQVLSFNRLSWRVFSEVGGQKVLIGETGKRMLLRRLLLKYRSQLTVFARSAKQIGTADLLAQSIAEFKMYQITPKELRQAGVRDETLSRKLEELALLYEEFNLSLGQDIRDPDDVLTIIADKIPFSDGLRDSMIWVDGFKGFTPQELHILKALLGIAKQITITVPLEPNIHRRAEGLGSEEKIFLPGEQIFYGSWKTYLALKRIAAEVGVNMANPVYLEMSYRFDSAVMKHLEKYFNFYPTQIYRNEDTQPIQEIQIFSAVNRRAECESVARKLRYLAREEGKRWRDLAVMTRDLAAYQEIIQQVFNAYEIPCFLDSKRSVLHHPLLELLFSALEIVRTDWAYEPVFRALKTGFFPLASDRVDNLENYCLSHGICGYAWSSGKPWRYRSRRTSGDRAEMQQKEDERSELFNQSRQVVYEILWPLTQDIYAKNSADEFLDTHEDLEMDRSEEAQKSERTLKVHTVTRALYNLLLRLDVPQQLKVRAEEARQQGALEEARLKEQIWDAVMGVLDEMVAGLGEECIELADYAIVLASGLENLKLGLIPPSQDQVLIGSLDRSRNPEVEMLFLIGANDGILPAKPVSAGVLDRIERGKLDQIGLFLAPKGQEQLFEEQYFIYSALTRAKERLYISYPLTDEDGKGLTLSPVVARLKTLFPDLEITYIDNTTDDLGLVSHPQALLPVYALQLQQQRRGQELSPLWLAVKEWFQQKDISAYPQVQLIESGVTAVNKEDDIPKPLARRLYGKRLLTSVTRLEKFARCPFAHYAQYGLRLAERASYQFASLDMGHFFHAILRDFAQVIQDRKLSWGHLSKLESWQLVSELTEKVVPELQNEILLSNARYRYLTHKLKRTVHHSVRVLAEHARLGSFMPIQLEVKFGPGETLPGIDVPLAEGDSLTLRGQIDRVDQVSFTEEVYLRIIDYKSSQSKISMNHIYYGLDIQLLAYLDTVLQGAEILLASPVQDEEKICHPAGILYFPVIEPALKSDYLLTPEQIEQGRIQNVKVSGYFLANRRVLEAMDQDLIKGKSSLLGLSLTKEGQFKKNAPILSEEQFDLLRQHLHQFLAKAGRSILSGHIAIAPFRQGNEVACTYCGFKAVCHFDPYLSENVYRTLPKLENQEIWSLVETATVQANDTNLTEMTQTSAGFNWLDAPVSGQDKEGGDKA